MIVSQKYQDLLQPYSNDRFSKNIENFLYKQKIVNNRSIPSTHTERQISDLSVKYSFTPYPSLSPYSQMESLTEKGIHSLHVGWRNFFPVVLLCQFLVLVGYRFWFYILTYLEYNTVVALCQFFGSGGKQFLVYVRTQCTIQMCGCVSFSVVAGKFYYDRKKSSSRLSGGLCYVTNLYQFQ